MMDLKKILREEIINLSDIMIVKDKNSYYLYNTYAIVNKKDHFKVFKITDTDHIITFTSLKNAVSWCILDYYKKLIPAKNLNRLELKLHSLNTDITVQKNIIKNMEAASFVNVNKLHEYFHQRKQIMSEIKKITDLSRDLQQRMFNKKDGKKYHYDKYNT